MGRCARLTCLEAKKRAATYRTRAGFGAFDTFIDPGYPWQSVGLCRPWQRRNDLADPGGGLSEQSVLRS